MWRGHSPWGAFCQFLLSSCISASLEVKMQTMCSCIFICRTDFSLSYIFVVQGFIFQHRLRVFFFFFFFNLLPLNYGIYNRTEKSTANLTIFTKFCLQIWAHFEPLFFFFFNWYVNTSFISASLTLLIQKYIFCICHRLQSKIHIGKGIYTMMGFFFFINSQAKRAQHLWPDNFCALTIYLGVGDSASR